MSIAGAALATFRAARDQGTTTYLQCSLAHLRFCQHLLREEAMLQPEFAGTLQLHDTPERFLRRRDAELAIADRVFMLSSFAERTYLEAGVDESKMIRTPLGVDLELFRPAPRPPDGIFRVVFVGQITQRKGISYLLEGFARAAIPDSELLFVGQIYGTAEPWIHQRGVKHLPSRPRYQLPDVYAQADVYVLPSLAEGFPLTAIEAMACGRPVIVSDHTFADDVVTDEEDGYIIPIRDSAAIADRLRYLADHPAARERVGQAAHRRAEEFSWESYGRRIAAILTTN